MTNKSSKLFFASNYKSFLITNSLILILLASQNIATLGYEDKELHSWLEGDPNNFGFNENSVNIEEEDFPFLRSLLVVRNDSLIMESYFNDASPTTALHIHSASKSFMSALIGIAFDLGILTDLNQQIMDFFPGYTSLDLDPRKYDITIGDLLSMKAGFNFNDTGDEWLLYSRSQDWAKYALELPLLHDPDKGWHYGTPQTNLLSIILTKASNMSTKDFAVENLLNPLGITIEHWYQDPQGYYSGGHEMYFTPRELARFGYLYLNNGSINGTQIISSDWVHESLQDYSNGGVAEGMRSTWYQDVGYGYQWWLQELHGYETFSARGLGGQNIFGVPELDMVIVTTATGTVFDEYPDQYTRMISVVEDHIIPAVEVNSTPFISFAGTTSNILIFAFLIAMIIYTLRRKK
ncbi:MAG: serine hydrolase domain-containing protein [Candidatus Kariarchaeaceae archaeon]|jgi:CubicO group peptidase (beta-lactamase class C family)